MPDGVPPHRAPSVPHVPGALTRRRWLALGSSLPLGVAAWGGGALPAHALPARTLEFPRDHGSHPDLRTEWWYITGHAQAEGRLWGFQVTFFRSRVDGTQGLQSRFAARQLVFAHAAVTDVQGRRLYHDQRIARAGFGIAEAAEGDTAVHLRDWHLVRAAADAPGASRYTAQVQGSDFALDLRFDSTQPVLLQGRQGLSRKGPEAAQASYYYSQPQLAVAGTLTLGGRRRVVEAGSGRAWMDHEWSEALMHPDAVGWDWIGMNLDDGRALTAFHLRRQDGSTLWAGGSVRAAGEQAPQVFAHDAVTFTATRHWASGRSGARYPVQWQVQTPAGTFSVHALLDDQELDSQGSTGAIYWEGLSELRDAAGRAVGRGYLEMTGYAKRLRLG
ncbi:lipocalin-like domain-containing protein [Acidovorax sp. NPDC077693]|uniref:lipocalin-like domain-containing protein n=1 Tax=unclassified Acidovorax TaxID=2684926 RepID=UPI0037CAD480